jgi:hypothetical protein
VNENNINKWTPEPWQTGREDAQSYYGDTGQPFSSVYRQDDDDRMPLTPDGFGGMTRVPLRIAYVEGKDIPRDEEKANARRIVACVNACTGLADPAAEIKAMREALHHIASMPDSRSINPRLVPVFLDKATSIALAALKAEGEVKSG